MNVIFPVQPQRSPAKLLQVPCTALQCFTGAMHVIVGVGNVRACVCWTHSGLYPMCCPGHWSPPFATHTQGTREVHVGL